MPERLYEARVRGRVAILHCTRCKEPLELDGRMRPVRNKLTAIPSEERTLRVPTFEHEFMATAHADSPVPTVGPQTDFSALLGARATESDAPAPLDGKRRVARGMPRGALLLSGAAVALSLLVLARPRAAEPREPLHASLVSMSALAAGDAASLQSVALAKASAPAASQTAAPAANTRTSESERASSTKAHKHRTAPAHASLVKTRGRSSSGVQTESIIPRSSRAAPAKITAP
jgi:hypothetical protein